jgi:hypothetical protein
LRIRDGLGRYLIGHHARLWRPSRAAMAELLEQNGLEVAEANDAAVMQFLIWLARLTPFSEEHGRAPMIQVPGAANLR